MGVLGDDDIEKISQAVRKKRIPKLFDDPIKGYKAYDIAVTVAALAIFGGVIYGLVVSTAYDQLILDYKSLQKQRDKIIDRSIAQSDLMVNNADCPSLLSMYHDAKGNPDLDYTKELIKDEIAFRCK